MQEIVAPRKRTPTMMYSPGVMGPVGNPNVQVELRHSNPQMKFRYDPTFSGKQRIRLGSNISDGQHLGTNSHGGPARILDSHFGSRPSFKTAHGWSYQSIVAEDRSSVAVSKNIPGYDWKNKIAKIYNSAHSGRGFVPPPSIIPPNFVPRGGSVPQIISKTAASVTPANNIAQPVNYHNQEIMGYRPPEDQEEKSQTPATSGNRELTVHRGAQHRNGRGGGTLTRRRGTL